MQKHLIIPDTQVKPGVQTRHMTWIGRYIVEKKPDVVVHTGDHWDFPSLSSYSRRLELEGTRVKADIEAGNAALEALAAPLIDYNAMRQRLKEKQYRPRLVMLRGNHEERLNRAVADNPQFQGLIGEFSFNDRALGWEVHKFLQPVVIDGVAYCHYFYNPMTGKPWAGTAQTKLRNIGMTFTMGHVQGIDLAHGITPDGRQRRALVAGSCYLHDENYKGPQANHHWRGISVKHEVQDGNYQLMEVSLDYLCRRYEGVPLAEWLADRPDDDGRILK